ncbi:hypothetical protein CVS40_10339 [Lucilia cuprina]|nr:hypothetical protein CVS40_10339 [Lucilia cuprina]
MPIKDGNPTDGPKEIDSEKTLELSNKNSENSEEQQTESLLKNNDETKTVDGATNILNEMKIIKQIVWKKLKNMKMSRSEAEDLTDDKDDNILDKSLNEDEEEDITKDSETEDNDLDTSPHEEETTKSSEAEESDKKSLNNDHQDDTCSKDYEEERAIENVPIEPELVAIEEGIKNTEETNTNDEQLNEDTSSQTTLYDPLNYDEDNDIVKAAENENSLENNDDDKAANNDDVKMTKYNLLKHNQTTMMAILKIPLRLLIVRVLLGLIIRTNYKYADCNSNFARKSTAKPSQPPQQSPGNNTPSHNTSSIAFELLDSSDEESPSLRKPQPKTPQKRTLLAAKGIIIKLIARLQIRAVIVYPTILHHIPPPSTTSNAPSNSLNAVQLQTSFKGTAETELDRPYCRWLEKFLNQFCKPQFVPNIPAFVTIFLKNVKKLTNYGRRFCELTCSSAHGKTVALWLMLSVRKVTLKTCNFDIPKTGNAAVTPLHQDEDEYTPDKSKLKTKAVSASENGDEDSGETGDDRKRSCKYNAKNRTKRLEAQKQRQQQGKSFERNVFIFILNLFQLQRNVYDLKNTTTATATSIRQYTVNNDSEIY